MAQFGRNFQIKTILTFYFGLSLRATVTCHQNLCENVLLFVRLTHVKSMIQCSAVKSFSESRQAQTASTVFDDFSWLNCRATYWTVIALILTVYSYPALRTAFTTRSTGLPAVSAPDLGLYLSLSQLDKEKSGAVINPYYHISVRPGSAAYIKFGSGPMFFGLVNDLFAGRTWWALFAWNLMWWLLLCLAGIWLFERFLPQPSVELVVAGLSLLMLFSIEGFGHLLRASIHLLPMRFSIELPYIRPFSPQVIMPLFLCYLGLQIRALSGKSVAAWGIMALLQFMALTAFPFATIMMAGTTAVPALWYIFSRPSDSAWRVVLGFVLVCALADIAFALYGSAGLGLGFPGQGSLIKFEPSLMGKSIGTMWVVTGILVAAIVGTPKIRPEVKWPLVGLGLSNMWFVLGDAFVSEPVFFLSQHIGYFYQSTIVILLIFLVSAYFPSGSQSLRYARILSLAVVGLCGIYGLLMAEGNYRINLPYNMVQADLATWFGHGKVSANDLVVTQFEGAEYDACEWIPLLSKAEVLYCRNAQLSLTAEQNRNVQRLREVLYLYFDGKDRQWLENSTQFERYGLYGELSSYRKLEERAQRIATLRREMLPIFDRAEHHDPTISDFFRHFGRVWIVRDAQTPAFVDERFASYLDIKEKEKVGGLLIMSATPK